MLQKITIRCVSVPLWCFLVGPMGPTQFLAHVLYLLLSQPLLYHTLSRRGGYSWGMRGVWLPLPWSMTPAERLRIISHCAKLPVLGEPFQLKAASRKASVASQLNYELLIADAGIRSFTLGSPSLTRRLRQRC